MLASGLFLFLPVFHPRTPVVSSDGPKAPASMAQSWALAWPAALAGDRSVAPLTAAAGATVPVGALSAVSVVPGLSEAARSILFGSVGHVGPSGEIGQTTEGGLTGMAAGPAPGSSAALCSNSATLPSVTTTTAAGVTAISQYAVQLSLLATPQVQQNLACLYAAAADSTPLGLTARGKAVAVADQFKVLAGGTQIQLSAAALTGITAAVTLGDVGGKNAAVIASLDAISGVLLAAPDLLATAVSQNIHMTTQVSINDALQQSVLASAVSGGLVQFTSNPNVFSYTCYVAPAGSSFATEAVQIFMELGQGCSDYAASAESSPLVTSVLLAPGALGGKIGDTLTCSSLVANLDGQAAPSTFLWELSTDGVSGWTAISSGLVSQVVDLAGPPVNTSTLLLSQAPASVATFAHQFVRCTAVASDGTAGLDATSAAVQSQVFAVVNSAPFPPASAAVSVAQATVGGSIACSYAAAIPADIDGDVVSYQVSWKTASSSSGPFGDFPLADLALTSSSTYVTRTGDIGNFLECVVSATDSLGAQAATSAVSGTTLVVPPAGTPVLATTAVSPTNLSSFHFTLNFPSAYSVTGLSLSGLSVTNGTASGLVGSGTSYSFDVAPAADGLVTIVATAGAAQDIYGTASLLSNTVSLTSDRTPPTSPAVAAVSPTNKVTPTWTWTSGGGGSGHYRLSLDDASLSAPTLTTQLSYSPAAPLSAATHVLYVEEVDDAGNWSVAGSRSVVIDLTPPAGFTIATITSPTPSLPIVSWSPAIDPSGEAVTYELVVSTTASGGLCGAAVPGATYSGLPATSQAISALPGSGTYYACITATNVAGDSQVATNNGVAFVYDSAAPGVFTLAAVSPNPTVAVPTITWTASTDAVTAVSYNLMISSVDASCSSVGTGLSFVGLPGLSKTLTGLTTGSYWVCLAAINGVGNSRVAINSGMTFGYDNTPPASFSINAVPSPAGTLPTISWGTASDNALGGAVSYSMVISSSFVAGTCGSAVGSNAFTSLTATSQASAALAAAGTYYVCVSAQDALGNETVAANNGVAFVYDNAQPTAFTLAAVTPSLSASQPTISWTASSDAVTGVTYSLTISSVDALCSTAGTGGETFTGLTVTTKAITGLPSGIYYVCLTAVGGTGLTRAATGSGESFTVDIDPPSVTALSLHNTVATSSSITLVWTPANDNFSPQANLSYLVLYSIGNNLGTTVASTFGAGSASGSPAANITTATVNGLHANTPYYFNVVVADQAGNQQIYSSMSAITSPVAATLTSVPTGYSQASSINVTVGGAGVTQYQYSVTSGTSCPSLAAYNALAPVASAINTGLGTDGPYTLCVIGQDVAGNVQPAPTMASWTKDTSPPSLSPASLAASGATTSAVALNWAAANDQVSPQNSLTYQVYFSTSSNLGSVSAAVANGTPYGSAVTNSTAATITGLPANTTYYFNVVVTDLGGNQAAFTPATATTLPIVATLAGTPTGYSKATMLGVAVAGTYVTQYQYAIVAGTSCSGAVYGPTTPVAVGANITDSLGTYTDGPYALCVLGLDVAGNRQPVATASYGLWTKDTTAPVVSATNLATSAVTTSTVNLTWPSAVDAITAAGNLTYQVYYSTSNNLGMLASVVTNGTTFGATTSNLVAKTVTGLTPGTTYWFNVMVFDQAGNQQIFTSPSATTSSVTSAISGVPTGYSQATTLAATVSGNFVTQYEYALVAGATCTGAVYGSLIPVGTLIGGSIGADGQYTLCVLGADASGNLQPAATSATWKKDTTAPVVTAASLIPSAPTSSAVTLSWAVANDNITPQATLTYQVYSSTANNIGTALAAIANGTASGSTQTNIQTATVSGLLSGATYYFNVVVSDQAGNQAVFTTASATTSVLSATLSGAPVAVSYSQAPTLAVTVGGLYVTQYRYALVTGTTCPALGSYGSQTPIATPIGGTIGADGQYTLCVLGQDAFGNAQLTATSVTWKLDTTPPTVTPLSLISTGATTSSVTLGWSPANDNLSAQISLTYQIFYSLSNNLGSSVASTFGAGTSSGAPVANIAAATVSGLSANTPYYFNVVVTDQALNQQVYTSMSATTSAVAATLTGVPTGYSKSTSLAVTVAGNGVTQYQYAIVSGTACPAIGSYGSVTPVATAISGAIGADGQYTLCVLGKDVAGNLQVTPTSLSWWKDTTSPALSVASLVATGITTSSITLAWTAGTDNISSSTNLTYQSYYSASNNINTTANALANGTAYGGGPIANFTTMTLYALAANTTYYLNVVVADQAGNQSVFTSIPVTTPAVVATITGAPTGISQATSLAVTVAGNSGAVTAYKYALVNGTVCPSTIGGYSATFTPVATHIGSAVSGNGNYILCVLGEDTAGNVQSLGSVTSASWIKDVQPTVVLPTAGASVNTTNVTAFTVAGTCTLGSGVSGTIHFTAGSPAVAIYPVGFVADQPCPTGGGAYTFNFNLSSVTDSPTMAFTALLTDQYAVASTLQSTSFNKNTVVPGPFSVTSPQGYSAPATPTLTWAGASGATSYTWAVSASSACTSPVQSGSTTAPTSSAALTSLVAGNYYVCVTASNGNTTVAANASTSYPFLLQVESSPIGLGQPDALTQAQVSLASAGSQSAIFGTKLYVAESSNSRVLIYAWPLTVNGQAPIGVIGQPSFSTSVANNDGNQSHNGLAGSTTLSAPQGVAVQTSGGAPYALWVLDSFNNRALRYLLNSSGGSIGLPINGAIQPAADLVIGQANYTATTSLNCSASVISANSSSIAVDSSGPTLYIAEPQDHAVLVWPLTSIVSGAAASYAIGQGTPSGCTLSSAQNTTINYPQGLAVGGGYLWIGDSNWNRATAFASPVTASYPGATILIGQTTYATTTSGVTQAKVAGIYNLYADASHLALLDRGNNRAMIWSPLPAANSTGTNASAVVGQATFTANSGATTQAGLNYPYGIAGDGTNLLINDSYRSLEYNPIPTTNGASASFVTGSSTFTATSPVSVSNSYSYPFAPPLVGGSCVLRGRLFASDPYYNRVLVYNTPPITTGATVTPDYVLGQTSLTGITANAGGEGGNTLSNPQGLFCDSTNNLLYVTDEGNSRVLMFNMSGGVSTGMTAVHVIGQASNSFGGPSYTQSTMYHPYAAWADSSYLWVVDNAIPRVTGYPLPITTDGPNATLVVGQTSFTGVVPGNTTTTFSNPLGVFSDGTNLLVADTGNNRVQRFSVAAVVTAGASGGTPASMSLGAGSAVCCTTPGSPLQNNLSAPHSVYSDGTYVYVTDTGFNRIMVWTGIPGAYGANASSELGQPAFTTTPGNKLVSPTTFNGPTSASKWSGFFYISDPTNYRTVKTLAIP